MSILDYINKDDAIVMEHQEETFELARGFLDKKQYAGIFLEMGLGKALISIALLTHLHRQNKIDSVLYICNKGSYLNYMNLELPKWIHPDIEYFSTYWDNATNGKRAKDIVEVYKKDFRLKIFGLNIEAISLKKGFEEAKKFVCSSRCLVIVDESSTIKNMSSNRTENALKLGDLADYRLIMTGTAITEGPSDLWSQCAFLDPFALGFNSFYAFRNRFCDLEKESTYQKGKKRDFIAIAGYKHLDELRTRLQKFCIIKTKKECLNLPDKMYETYDVEMTKDQKYYYNKFRKEALLAIEDHTVSATIILSKLTKLHQIACGFVITDESQVLHLPNNRLKSLQSIIEEGGQKVVIWAPYVGLIRIIAEFLRKEYGDNSTETYFGETTTQERQRIAQRFQIDPTHRFFVGNTSVGGYGITLTESQLCVYYANKYSAQQRWQSEDRLHRIGQKNPVTYVDMLVRGTIEERILEVLKTKKDVASAVMESREEARKLLGEVF